MNSTEILHLVLKELATNLTNTTDFHHNDDSKHIEPIHDEGEHHEEEHEDENDNDYNTIIAKSTAMVVLFCASTFCGCIPFLLNRRYKWTENNTNARSATVVKCLLYFGGGVLLCTTFLHLLPEVKENIESLQSNHVLPNFGFNFAEFLMCMGFFAMFLVEELIHSYIHRQNNNVSTSTNAFVRGVSITQSYLLKRKSNSSSQSSARTTTSSARDSVNRKAIKSKNDIDIEQNQSATTNNIIDNLVNESENQNKQILPTASESNLGVINESYEHEKKPDHHSDSNNEIKNHLYNKNIGNNYHQQQQHDQEHHSDKQKNSLVELEKKHVNHGTHGHSHLPIGTIAEDFNENQIVASLRGLLIVLALSIHELFEGLAVGLESRTHNVWYMFGAVSAHKFVLAFCVGVELIVTRTKLWLAIVYVITFAIVSPIGIGIGILVSSYDNGTASAIPSAILQGLATGTLLYVVFFEILSKERSGLIPYASFVVGFAVMFGLQFATGHEHSHDHGHGHDHGHSHKYHSNSNDDDDIDYTKKSIQEQIEILRAAGRELLEKNPNLHYTQHQHQH